MRFIEVSTCLKRMHIGKIVSCKIGESKGVILGLSQVKVFDGEGIYKKKYFLFDKNEKFTFAEGCMVTFLVDVHKKEDNATNIIDLKELETLYNHRGIYREGLGYHDDVVWEHLVGGIPYIDFEKGRHAYIVLPIKQNDTIYIHEGVLSGQEHIAYELFYELQHKSDKRWTDYTNMAQFIKQALEYIDKMKVDKLISEYTICREEYLKRRPGHDDHYIITKICNLKTVDPYLNYLLPSKNEIIFFDDNWSSNVDEDNSGTYYLEEETLAAQRRARENYTKFNHLSFLIMDEMKKNNEEYEQICLLEKRLEEIFDLGDLQKQVNWNNKLPDNIIDIVQQINKMV